MNYKSCGRFHHYFGEIILTYLLSSPLVVTDAGSNVKPIRALIGRERGKDEGDFLIGYQNLSPAERGQTHLPTRAKEKQVKKTRVDGI